MKYGISKEKGIKELIDCVIFDLEMLQLNTLKTIELKFRINPSYQISDLIYNIEKIYDLVGDRDIEIVLETDTDESVPSDECYLEANIQKNYI